MSFHVVEECPQESQAEMRRILALPSFKRTAVATPLLTAATEVQSRAKEILKT